jgi:adenosylcobyric acid synthase
LAFMRAQGWDIDLAAHVRRGGRVLGVCGGYQMLGRRVADPDGLEGPPGEASGLSLLDVETVLTGAKVLRPVRGRLRQGAAFEGYEIHAGRTSGPGLARPFLTLDDGAPDGAVSADEHVAGAYVHGLFGRSEARATILAELGAASRGGHHTEAVDAALDEIAEVLARSLDVTALSRLAGLEKAV